MFIYRVYSFWETFMVLCVFECIFVLEDFILYFSYISRVYSFWDTFIYIFRIFSGCIRPGRLSGAPGQSAPLQPSHRLPEAPPPTWAPRALPGGIGNPTTPAPRLRHCHLAATYRSMWQPCCHKRLRSRQLVAPFSGLFPSLNQEILILVIIHDK